jgi:hypothetical protein
MISREGNHHGVGINFLNMHSSQTQAGSRISSYRFEEKIFGGNLGDRLMDLLSLEAGGDNENFFPRDKGTNPIDGLPDHGLSGEDRKNLFGLFFPAPGPEARAATPRHDNHVGVRLFRHKIPAKDI